MPHVAANLRPVALAWIPLWVAILLPFGLAALAALVLASREAPRLQGLRAAASSAGQRLGLSRAGLGAAVGLALSLLCVAVSLAQAAGGERKLLLSPGARVFRIGSLDGTLSASLDLGRGLAAAGALFAFGLLLRRTDSPSAPPSRPLAVAALASGACGVLLGDGALTLLASLELLVGGTLLLGFEGGAPDARPALLVLGGGQLAVAACAVLFGFVAWSFGGSWLEGQGEAPGTAVYLPAQRPRFALVERGDRPKTEADTKSTRGKRDAAVRARELAKSRAYLTMLTHPGARVYLGVGDQLQLRGAQPIAISPFVRLPINAGVQTLAIAPDDGGTVAGDGWEVAAIENVNLDADEDRTLTLLGASLGLHDLESQAQLVGADGVFVVAEGLAGSKPLGSLGTSAALLGLFAALAWVGGVLAALRGGDGSRVRKRELVLAASIAAAGLCVVSFPRLGFLWEAAQAGKTLALGAWLVPVGLVIYGFATLPKQVAPAPGRAPAPEPAPRGSPEPKQPIRRLKKKKRKGVRA